MKRSQPQAFVQNPTLELGTKPVVRFRVRGTGRQEVDDPAVIRALRDGTPPSPELSAALVRTGIFLRAGEVPTEVQYRCPLALERPALYPRFAESRPPSRRPIVNRRTYWQRSPSLPKPLRNRTWRSLGGEMPLAPPPILWVEDPATRILAPYWPDRQMSKLLTRLEAGQDPRTLSQAEQLLLADARLLIPSEQRPIEAMAGAMARSLAVKRFLVLRDLFPPLQIAHLRRYFRDLEAEGYLTHGDSQVPRRHVIYGEPLLEAIQAQFVPLLNLLTGEPLKASYTYSAVYQPGAVLEKHVDREQCRWNLSVIWDTRPERGRANAWPIHLEVEGKAHQVMLGMGDGVLYRGTELPHWRPRQPRGNFTAATFFHFVHQAFKGSLD